jgi:DNA-binding CsgD family transcriptional regulator
MEKLHEYIKAQLAENVGVFQSKVIQRGLDSYLKRYEQSKQDPEHKIAPLIPGNAPGTDDGFALAVAILCALHDYYLTLGHIIPDDWPAKRLLENSTQRYMNHAQDDTAAGWGKTFKSDFISMLEIIKSEVRKEDEQKQSTGNGTSKKVKNLPYPSNIPQQPGLTLQQSYVYHYYVIKNMAQKDIAAILGISQAGVSKCLKAAKKKRPCLFEEAY